MLFLGVGRDGSDCVMVLDGGEDGVGVVRIVFSNQISSQVSHSWTSDCIVTKRMYVG